jgi:hypothetical protein
LNAFSKNLTKERVNSIMKFKKTTFKGMLASALVIFLTLSVFATSPLQTDERAAPQNGERCLIELELLGYTGEEAQRLSRGERPCETRLAWDAFVDSLTEDEIEKILAGGDFPVDAPFPPALPEGNEQLCGVNGLVFVIHDLQGNHEETITISWDGDMSTLSSLLPEIDGHRSATIFPVGSWPQGWHVTGGWRFSFAYRLSAERHTLPEIRRITGLAPGTSYESGFGSNVGRYHGYSAAVSSTAIYAIMLHNLSPEKLTVTDFRARFHSNINDALAWVRLHRPPNAWPINPI